MVGPSLHRRSLATHCRRNVAPGGSHLTIGLPHSGVRSPPTRHRGDHEIDRPDLHAPCRRRGAPRGRAERRQRALRPPMEMDHAAWHPASPLQALTRLRVTAACPRLCRLGAPNYPDLVEVVAVSLAVAALFCLSAVHSWVAPRSPSRTRREVLSQVLGQRPKLTASPSGQADPGAAYYRVIRTRVPSGIPDSRCNAAGGTRTQPLLTAWPNTDRSGQPCRPTVPGPPPKVDSALE